MAAPADPVPGFSAPVHRALIAAHLEKDLKSARVLRDLRGPE